MMCVLLGLRASASNELLYKYNIILWVRLEKMLAEGNCVDVLWSTRDRSISGGRCCVYAMYIYCSGSKSAHSAQMFLILLKIKTSKLNTH